MEKKITLFHGSEKVIEHPVLGAGKKHNDFGLGFFTARKARHWQRNGPFPLCGTVLQTAILWIRNICGFYI